MPIYFVTSRQKLRTLVGIVSIALGLSSVVADMAHAQNKWRKVQAKWEASCGVDKGAIVKKRGNYIFRRSKNYCGSTVVWPQRTELRGGDVPIKTRASYKFSSIISMTSKSNNKFTFYQLHDARYSCAPPLKLDWTSANTLRFTSAYAPKDRSNNCVQNRSIESARYHGKRLSRDGTKYKLDVIFDFHGNGPFDVTVFIDGKPVMSGKYNPSRNPNFFVSKRYYMKMGVYSKYSWDFLFTAEKPTVYRKRLK